MTIIVLCGFNGNVEYVINNVILNEEKRYHNNKFSI